MRREDLMMYLQFQFVGSNIAISICGQQHGMITLDSDGYVIRPALLWNDVRSAGSAEALNAEYPDIATRSGSRLVAAFTASKIRWLVDHEPSNAARVASICLPHDWLSWKLLGDCKLESLVTDRSDASGTGYFNPITSKYDFDIFSKSIRSNRTIVLPRVLKGNEIAGEMPNGVKICAGGGDNAGAAFGLQAEPGDVIISLGTSGTAFAVSDTPTQDSVGEVAGFADLTGRYLPLVCTLNAARILDAATSILNCTYDDLAELALAAPPGANGLTLLPYFEGERTPNRPDATGVLAGLTLANSNRNNIARAYIEGMLCGLADAVDALVQRGVTVNRVLLIGGAAKNRAVAEIASAVLGRELLVPPTGEYVANGAARQAAWAILGDEKPPTWDLGHIDRVCATPTPNVLLRYRQLRDRTSLWEES